MALFDNAPIWKDRIVDLGTTDSKEFAIEVVGVGRIYEGKAWKKPGADNIEVRVNDICADYLYNVIPQMAQSEFEDLSFPVTFKTVVPVIIVDNYGNETTSYVIRDEVNFLNDWSYDYSYDPSVDGMAFPINHKVDLNQWVVWTGFDVNQVVATIELVDGTTTQVTLDFSIPGDFNNDFNSDFLRMIMATATGTTMFKPSTWGDVKSITINGIKYEVVNCNRYVLYYANAHGGWDSLVVEGNHTEIDNLTRYTREVDYDNRTIQNRGRINFVNEITKSITLHTSWLKDDESARMHHLLNATNVYLYDIVTDEFIPVILGNTTTEYKTYRNNGNKLVNYTIDAVFANERIRR